MFLPRKQQFGFALGFAQRAEGVWQKPRLISASSTSSSSLPRSICQKKLVKHDRFLKLEIKRVFGKKKTGLTQASSSSTGGGGGGGVGEG